MNGLCAPLGAFGIIFCTRRIALKVFPLFVLFFLHFFATLCATGLKFWLRRIFQILIFEQVLLHLGRAPLPNDFGASIHAMCSRILFRLVLPVYTCVLVIPFLHIAPYKLQKYKMKLRETSLSLTFIQISFSFTMETRLQDAFSEMAQIQCRWSAKLLHP